jgi:hypothetical protein
MPGLEAADDVRHIEAELAEGGRGEARLVALVADQDERQVPAGELRNPVLALGVEAPFQDISRDEDRAENQPVGRALRVRSHVDQGRPAIRRLQGLPRREPAQPPSRRRHQVVN